MTFCASNQSTFTRVISPVNCSSSRQAHFNERREWTLVARRGVCRNLGTVTLCAYNSFLVVGENQSFKRKEWKIIPRWLERGSKTTPVCCATSAPADSEEEGEGESDPLQEDGATRSPAKDGGGDVDASDWRSFRARLVAQSHVAASGEPVPPGLDMWQARQSTPNCELLKLQNPKLAEEGLWAHPIGSPEQGGILLAAAQKLVPGSILQSDPLSPFQECVVYFGGLVADGRDLHLIHGYPLEGSQEVVPGLFVGGLEAASQAVREGTLRASEFRFFVGRVEWRAGQLDDEVARRHWIPAACSRGVVLKHCIQLPTPLWREVSELMGGEYRRVAREAYGISDEEDVK